MPMKVEAAVVTEKQAAAVFNTDSININGKTFPEEVLKNGYKGSGVVSGNVHFALASSMIEGFSGATVRAFEERADKFPVTRDPKNIFSGFFEDCRSALLNMKKQAEELGCACLYASGRTITVAGNGDAGLYAMRFGSCSEVISEKAENTVADYNLAVISDVNENDIYILLSPAAAKALTVKDIDDICTVSDGSVKRIVSLISKVASANGAEGAVTVIAVKVLETASEKEISSAGFMPDFAAMEKMLYGDEAENNASEPVNAEGNTAVTAEEKAVEEVAEAVQEEVPAGDTAEIAAEAETAEADIQEDAYVENGSTAEAVPVNVDETASDTEITDSSEALEEISDENTDDNTEDKAVSGKSDKKTRIMLFSILGIMFAISVALIGLIAVELLADKLPVADTTVNATEETTEEETTEEETTGEETTEEETTEEEAATNNEETTTKRSSVSTPASSVTTTRNQQTAQTTKAPETTAAPTEATTAEQASFEQDTTEEPSEETTAAEPSSAEEPAAENTEETQNAEEQNNSEAAEA